MPGWEIVDEPKKGGGWEVVEQPKADDWQPTQYGFKVKPAVAFNGKPTVEREDGAQFFGPDQGNTGKPGWFDAKGNRLGDVPRGPVSAMDRLRNVANGGITAKDAVTAIGNAPVLGLPNNGQGYVAPTGRDTGANLAGMVQGAVEMPAGIAQTAAHLVGSNAVDRPIDAMGQYFQQNFNPSTQGRVLGQTIPLVATMGGGAPVEVAGNAGKVRAALEAFRNMNPIAKGAITGATLAPVLTPEYNIQDDYWKRKGTEAAMGGLVGAAIPAVASGVGKLAKGAKVIGNAPSTTELSEELAGRLGGKTPGQALQDAAQAKYNEAWDEFAKAVAPVDEAAGNVQMDYKPVIQKLDEVLGVGQRRSPVPIPKERKEVLEALAANLKEAGGKDAAVDNSFQGAIDTIKWLGAEQRRLAIKHGDTEARAMLGDVRDAILEAMQQSSPELAKQAKNARGVFATRVAPLFDKSEGGNFLTQIRDTPAPGDLLASGNQGSLARMKPDRAAIVAKGSSADPMLYSYLDAAIGQSNGNPTVFKNSLQKAMPAIEAIGDQKTVDAFKGLVTVAESAKYSGWLANMGLAYASPQAGGALAIGGHLKPAYSGPGLIWKLLQNPSTRAILREIGNLAPNSPAIKPLQSSLAAITATKEFSNVRPLRPMPAAASMDPASSVAQNQE